MEKSKRKREKGKKEAEMYQ
uniref:Uncharacterized protein n=1 Tax=Vitis vinifera TaxID=29760 RepID=F6H2T6_VITVI